jgi:bla regulator protein blaR1
MNTLLIYMVKAAVYLAGFFLVYRLFLSKDTLYSRNRTYILISVISALILPLITIQTNKPLNIPVFGKILSDIFVTGTGNKNSSAIQDISTVIGYKGLSIIYFTGLIFFGLKLIIDFLELAFLISRNDKIGSHIIRFHGLNTAGFSAFGYIFINSRISSEETKEIINHEQNHLNHRHSFDIVFIETVKVFQWFNPFIHLFSRSLRAVHEYQADEECISLGTSVSNYQRLLMNQTFKSKIFTVTSSFSNPSLIRKRMIMMTKQRSKSMTNLKMLIIMPVIALVMLAFSTCSEEKPSSEGQTGIMIEPPPPPPPPVPGSRNVIIEQPSSTDESAEPFVVVEEMPVFPGGESGLLKYLGENIQYPESAKVKGIQGKVIIRFAIDNQGKITKEAVLKSVDPVLDEEALRVVRTLPRFEPGRQGGKAVPVWYMVPINFTLK